MPHQATHIEDVLDHLYLAAGEPSGWTDCIISLARVFEADAAVFLAQRSGDPGCAVGASTGISADLIRSYDEYFNTVDPWFLALRAREVERLVARGSELCPLPELKRSEYGGLK